jgi:hypothetical protein
MPARTGIEGEDVCTSRQLALLLLAMLGPGTVANGQPMSLPPKPPMVGAQNAEVRAEIATTKAVTKTTTLTRQQIQALRLALKAKLAALRH